MEKKLSVYSLYVFLFLFSSGAFAQSPIGIWKNIDDEDGEAKSHIEIYEEDGLLHGRVIKLLEKATLRICKKCKGDRKNQPIENMVIMWDLKKDGEEWDQGKILDPKKGKEYSCKIALKNENELEVRGYLKFAVFGRSQSWYRVTESE